MRSLSSVNVRPSIFAVLIPDAGFVVANPEYHLPQLDTFDGIVDICSLLNLMELANVLNLWTYGEHNPQDVTERLRMINAREKARILRMWIFQHYQLVDLAGEAVDGENLFYWPYLAQQARAIYYYKRLANDAEVGHRDGQACTLEAVKEALKSTCSRPLALHEAYMTSEPLPTTFAWAGPCFTVKEVIPKLSNGTFLICI